MITRPAARTAGRFFGSAAPCWHCGVSSRSAWFRHP